MSTLAALSTNLSFVQSLFSLPHARVDWFELGSVRVPQLTAGLWTAKQRQASSLHEISYRACFKPQLPRFFVERLTKPGDWVYDPFAGRGTTAIEAALLGRNVAQNDVNPLSRILSEPRLCPPASDPVQARLATIKMDESARADIDLGMFYHPRTEAEIVSLRNYLNAQRLANCEDSIDRWIRMIATNRLTGHSPGFLSVYTLPPNQAVSAERQIKINARLQQQPPYRDLLAIILRKTQALLKDVKPHQRELLRIAAQRAIHLTANAAQTDGLAASSQQLTVTSPPFLDVVQYASDNWLRSWFNGIDAAATAAKITMARTVGDWSAQMLAVLRELYRITRPGGWVAFEVGEVRGGKVRLDETILPLGAQAGFAPVCVLINAQAFTKTANIWGIGNNARGTNSNRIVVLRRE